MNLQQQIRAAWLDTSKPERRTRDKFQAFYRRSLRKLGAIGIFKAKDDDGGNCLTCGEAGRCPGWHYESETFY